jgi:hypothetical protein
MIVSSERLRELLQQEQRDAEMELYGARILSSIEPD